MVTCVKVHIQPHYCLIFDARVTRVINFKPWPLYPPGKSSFSGGPTNSLVISHYLHNAFTFCSSSLSTNDQSVNPFKTDILNYTQNVSSLRRDQSAVILNCLVNAVQGNIFIVRIIHSTYVYALGKLLVCCLYHAVNIVTTAL